MATATAAKCKAYLATVTLPKSTTTVPTAMKFLETALGRKTSFHWVVNGTTVQVLMSLAQGHKIPEAPIRTITELVRECMWKRRGLRFAEKPLDVKVSVVQGYEKKRVPVMECMLVEGAEHGHSSNTQPWDDLEKTVTQNKKKPRGGSKHTLAASVWAWFDGLGPNVRSRLTMRDVVARYVAACVETRTPCDQRECLALCNTVLASADPGAVVDAILGVDSSTCVQMVCPEVVAVQSVEPEVVVAIEPEVVTVQAVEQEVAIEPEVVAVQSVEPDVEPDMGMEPAVQSVANAPERRREVWRFRGPPPGVSREEQVADIERMLLEGNHR